MITKLRRKFILITMTSVTAVILLLCLAINAINCVSANKSINNMLRLIYENQGVMPDVPKDAKPRHFNGLPISPETPYATRYFVLIYGDRGELLSSDMRHIAAVTAEDAGAYLSVAVKHGDGFGFSGSYKFYTVTDGGTHTAIFLDCRQQLGSVRTFAAASALASAVCIILVYVLVLLLSKRAIDPVVKSAERQKQFITDAGHELKTPLTVITTSLKVLEMEVGKQKWIDKAQGQADKMRDLVNDLITLSRLDEEKPRLNLLDFNASDAVSETAASFTDFAMAQGRSLELSITPGLIYCGDEYAVRQLVSILLDNAVKYSDEGGIIRLKLDRGKRGIVLEVYNTCSGIDGSELDRLFDRFYRVEGSRSKETGGFGVGLSIAKSIAETHKGSITARCPDDHSILFTAVLR